MIGDNDDFVLSAPMLTTTSSMQVATSPILVPNAKSTTLESDSSSNSSSNSSDSSSSDSEAENTSTTANGK